MLSLIGFATLFASTSHAGALGIISHSGAYQGKSYYYRSDGQQGIDSQFRPNYGIGIEALLGDNDDRLQGLIRFYINQDVPVVNPEVPSSEEYTYTHPDYESLSPRTDGLISVGLQWGLWGEPTAFQLIATTSLTSCFWTVDNLEYVSLEGGLGATYTLGERIQFHGTAAFSPRYKKQLFLAGNGYLSVRYLFD